MSIKGYLYEFKDLCGAVYNFSCDDLHKYYISTNNGQLRIYIDDFRVGNVGQLKSFVGDMNSKRVCEILIPGDVAVHFDELFDSWGIRCQL